MRLHHQLTGKRKLITIKYYYSKSEKTSKGNNIQTQSSPKKVDFSKSNKTPTLIEPVKEFSFDDEEFKIDEDLRNK